MFVLGEKLNFVEIKKWGAGGGLVLMDSDSSKGFNSFSLDCEKNLLYYRQLLEGIQLGQSPCSLRTGGKKGPKNLNLGFCYLEMKVPV